MATVLFNLDRVSWAGPERLTDFDVNDFAMQGTIILSKIRHLFYEHLAHPWNGDQYFTFKIYEEDRQTLIFESEVLEAYKNIDPANLTPTEYQLSTPLTLGKNFCISVAPIASTGFPSGIAQYVSYNNSHSYNGTTFEWEISAEEWATSICIEEGGDTDAPEIVSFNGNEVNIGMNMILDIIVSDASEISSIIVKYSIDGGDENEVVLEPVDNRSLYAYTGQISACSSTANGEIYFIMNDIEGNESTTDIYTITWIEDSVPPEIEFVNTPDEVYFLTGGEVSVIISDGSGILSAELLYTVEGMENSVTMNHNPETNLYIANIPPNELGEIGTYYISAIDNSENNNLTNSEIIEIEWSSTIVHIYDSFESYESFSTSFSPWILNDIDDNSTVSIYNLTFPNQTEKMAYIIFSPSETYPRLEEGSAYWGHSGLKYASSFRPYEDGQNNDWMITQKITLGTDGRISFWAKTVYEAYEWERFRVGVSTTGTEEEDFEIISEGEYIVTDDQWTEYSFDLSGYESENVHIGINCVSNDGFMFMVDDVKISSSFTVGIDENNYELGIRNYELKQNYPNPFNPRTRIIYELGITNYELAEIVVYNANGQSVWSKPLNHLSTELHGNVQFDGSAFNSGVYYYSLVVDGKRIETKSMILIK